MLLPRHFSLVAFMAANVLIDIEVLVQLLLHARQFHRHCHTLVGATGLGVLAGVLTFLAARRLRHVLPRGWRSSPLWLRARRRRLFWVCLLSGVVGGVSHVLLDSLMHPEIRLLWPLSGGGWLYGFVSRPALHLACVLTGLLGLVLWLMGELRRPSFSRRPTGTDNVLPGTERENAEE